MNQYKIKSNTPKQAQWVELCEYFDGTKTLKSDCFPYKIILNELASEIWILCDGDATVEEIFATYQQQHPDNNIDDQNLVNTVLALQSQSLVRLGNGHDVEAQVAHMAY